VSEGGLEPPCRGSFPRVVRSPAACSSAAKTGEISPSSVPEHGSDPVFRWEIPESGISCGHSIRRWSACVKYHCSRLGGPEWQDDTRAVITLAGAKPAVVTWHPGIAYGRWPRSVPLVNWYCPDRPHLPKVVRCTRTRRYWAASWSSAESNARTAWFLRLTQATLWLPESLTYLKLLPI